MGMLLEQEKLPFPAGITAAGNSDPPMDTEVESIVSTVSTILSIFTISEETESDRRVKGRIAGTPSSDDRYIRFDTSIS